MTKPLISYVDITETEFGFQALSQKIDIEVLGEDVEFTANLVAYPNVLPGSIPIVKFPSNLKPIIPTETTSNHWISVRVGNEIFWSYTYKNKEQYLSRAYNSNGQMLISDGIQRLTLNIECNTLTLNDLNDAIRDFKCDLLKIIFSDSNIFTNIYREDFAPVLSDEALFNIIYLINSIEKVSNNLKSRLNQKDSLVAIHKAKPTTKGIKELTINPSIKRISSLVTTPNYNTGENQYVLSTALKLRQILFSIFEMQSKWIEDNSSSKVDHFDDLPELLNLNLKKECTIQKTLDDINHKHHLEVSKSIKNQNINELIHRLDKIIRKLKNHEIKHIVSSFNPMVFVQNPTYSKFKAARNRFFRGTIFSYLTILDQINERFSTFSITTLPNFYERWCLVQLINILTNHFHYKVVGPKWKKAFAILCLYNKYNIRINFEKTFEGRKETISLIYQAEFTFDNKRIRPDFIIETPNNTWVADAKFRTRSNNDELMKLCLELSQYKTYNLNKNAPVFLFHCAPLAGKETPNNKYNHWKHYCNYGSDKFGYLLGHIFLSPRRENKKQSTDNLIRWLLLIFQDANMPTCPACGKRLTVSTTRGKGLSYKCESCQFESVKTHCFKCGSLLWKNTWYWSYNLFVNMWTDVLCPYCGKHFGSKKQSQ